MSDTWEMISERQKQMGLFYSQVDKTRKRLNLDPFKLKDPLTNEYVDDVVNVTENKSASYMVRIIAGLMASEWQTVVEGKISSRDAHKVEQFIDANLQQADEYLISQYGIASLDAWLSNHVCHTSLIGVQWVASIDDGEYRIHCLPLDMRWTPFVQNRWIAPITWRDKEDLLEEIEKYEKAAKDSGSGDYYYLKPDKLEDTNNEVRDYWTPEVNELWVNERLVFKQPNQYGKLNSVIIWPPSGFMFRDKGYLEHESPGLLFLNMDMYEQLSRQLTVDATLGYNSLEPAHEYETKTPGGETIPVPRRGETQQMPEGSLHRPVPTPDINSAELATREQVSRLLDEAAPMTPRAYTTPPSAIEVTTEVELLGELQNPRIIALKMLKQQLARLMIDQFICLGGKGEAGRYGGMAEFTVADLKDPTKYTISYQLMKQNKRLAIVNETRALAAWGKFPMKYILKEIAGVQDPDGWMREMELEKAKAANPAISLAEMAVRYAEEAEDTEDEVEKDFTNWQSMMLVHDYVTMMRQRLQPAMPEGETQNIREATADKSNAGGLISMLGRGGGAMPRLPAGQSAGMEQ